MVNSLSTSIISKPHSAPLEYALPQQSSSLSRLCCDIFAHCLGYLTNSDLAALRLTCRMIKGDTETNTEDQKKTRRGLIAQEFFNRAILHRFFGGKSPQLTLELLRQRSVVVRGLLEGTPSYEELSKLCFSSLSDLLTELKDHISLIDKLVMEYPEDNLDPETRSRFLEFESVAGFHFFGLMKNLLRTENYNEWIEQLSHLTTEEKTQCRKIINKVLLYIETSKLYLRSLYILGSNELKSLATETGTLKEMMSFSSDELRGELASRELMLNLPFIHHLQWKVFHYCSNALDVFLFQHPQIKLDRQTLFDLLHIPPPPAFFDEDGEFMPATKNLIESVNQGVPGALPADNVILFWGEWLLSHTYTLETLQRKVHRIFKGVIMSERSRSDWPQGWDNSVIRRLLILINPAHRAEEIAALSDEKLRLEIIDLIKPDNLLEVVLGKEWWQRKYTPERIHYLLDKKALSTDRDCLNDVFTQFLHFSFRGINPKEERIALTRRLLEEVGDQISTNSLKEVFWSPSLPEIREKTQEVLALRESFLSNQFREFLHTICALCFVVVSPIEDRRCQKILTALLFPFFFLTSTIDPITEVIKRVADSITRELPPILGLPIEICSIALLIGVFMTLFVLGLILQGGVILVGLRVADIVYREPGQYEL